MQSKHARLLRLQVEDYEDSGVDEDADHQRAREAIVGDPFRASCHGLDAVPPCYSQICSAPRPDPGTVAVRHVCTTCSHTSCGPRPEPGTTAVRHFWTERWHTSRVPSPDPGTTTVRQVIPPEPSIILLPCCAEAVATKKTDPKQIKPLMIRCGLIKISF